MSDGNKMSRRDWFRLRSRRAQAENKPTVTAAAAQPDAEQRETTASTDHAMGETPNGLQPIAHPENHDGMDLAKLPPMREAVLTEEQVLQLFSDIEALGTDILLMQRSARSQRATPTKATSAEQLRAAQESLLAGAVPRVQIRYQWQETHWIDTLQRGTDGVRLVRIAHSSETAGS